MNKVKLYYSKRNKQFEVKYPTTPSRNGSILAKSLLYMLTDYEKKLSKNYNNFKHYLEEGGFDPETFKITVDLKKGEE